MMTENISDVSSELKCEILFMERAGKTPKEFGLKVRRYRDTLSLENLQDLFLFQIEN